MKLIRGASWTRIEADDQTVLEAVARSLDKILSYHKEGAEFSEAFQKKRWDGRIRLLKRLRNGVLAFPAGFTEHVRERLRQLGVVYEFQDTRLPPRQLNKPVEWTGHTLRDYQEEAVAAFCTSSGGVLRLPVRSGKTAIAAAIIEKLRVRTLFLAPSELLVNQTVRDFKSSLRGWRISTFGLGIHDDTGEVVVATPQTLTPRVAAKEFNAFRDAYELVIVDEVHHATSDDSAWRDLVMHFNAPRKLGLSGTVDSIDDPRGGEASEEAIWLTATCGPILYSRTISDLIERGHLVRPTIRFVRYDTPDLDKSLKGQAIYSQGIVQCKARNERILTEALRYVRDGKQVLVDVSRIGHTRALGQSLRRALSSREVAILTGNTPTDERERAVDSFRQRKVRVLVGTILGEGVNLPELDVVINAEGGSAYNSVVQRLRNVTPCNGKVEAIVVEMADTHHKRLKSQTLARLRIYKGEPAFRFEVEKSHG